MNIRHRTIIATAILIVSFTIVGCVGGQLLTPTPHPTPTSLPPAFTGAVTPGAWSSGGINVFLDKEENTKIVLLISDDGKHVLQFQFRACGYYWGNNDMPIKGGTFSFVKNIGIPSKSCSFTGTINVIGIFESKDKAVGNIEIGSHVTSWEAAPSK
jgi:hypothetical protein